MAKLYQILILFLLFSSITFAQQVTSPETEIALQKYTAQVNAKIDTQVNRLENAMQQNMQIAKDQLKEEMGKEIKSYLKGVAIGIIGLIVVTLSIFRIIELKLNHTIRIKRYEKELLDSKAQYDKMVAEMNEYQINIMAYKSQLDQIASTLQNQGYQTPQSPPNMNIPKPKKGMKILIIILVIIAILIVTAIVFLNLPNLIGFFKTAQTTGYSIKVGN